MRYTSLSITRQEYIYRCVIFSLGVWVWLTALPTLILNSKKEDTEICTRDYIGWSLWLVGMLIEAIADYQKYTFRNNPANKYVRILYSLIYNIYYIYIPKQNIQYSWYNTENDDCIICKVWQRLGHIIYEQYICVNLFF